MAKKLKRPPKTPLVFAPTAKGKKAESTYKASHEVAGPYRSQSSIPSIRKKATSTEHRRVVSEVRRPHSGPPMQSEAGDLLAVPSLPKAIARSKRQLRKETQRKLVRIKALDSLRGDLAKTKAKLPPEPHTIYQQARAGKLPPASEKREYPRAYKRAQKVALAKLASKEGLKEDPAAELAISTAATAGIGGLASLAAKGAESGAAGLLARGGSQIASKGVTAAESAAERGVKAVASSLEKKATKIRTTPARVKSAPTRARRAVATKEGRRAAAQQTARSARRHPVRSSYGAAAVSPVPLPGEADKRARAFAEGSAKALVGHPAETLETTGRSLAGAITGPAALLGATASSIKHGTPEPLVETAKEQAEGVGHIVGQAFSGDVKKAEQAARKEGSLALATPLPALTRLGKYEKGRGVLRETAAKGRRKLAKRSERMNRNVRHAPEGVETHVFGILGRHEHRKQTALLKQRIDNPHRVKRAKHEANITHAIAKAPEGSHVALQTLAEYGIRGPKGAALVRHKGPGDKQLIAALDYADAHPEIYKSKDFERALQGVQRAAETAPAALVGKGERARLLAQGDLLNVPRPESGVPVAARNLTSAQDRVGAWDDLHQRDLQLKALKRQGREKFSQAKVVPSSESKSPTLAGVREQVAHDGINLEVTERGPYVNFEMIRSEHPGAGNASSALKALTDYADRTGKTIVIRSAESPAGLRGGLSRSQLTAWYKRHGFVANKGANKDYAVTGELLRPPSAPKTVGGSREQLLKEGKAFYAQARKLQKDNKALYDALSPYTHPEHSIDQSKRMVYDDKMLAEYKRQVEAARKQAGLAPAIWTHHGPVDQAGSGMVGAYSKTPGVEHMREGTLAAGDNLDRSLEGLIRGTVHLPRQREAARQFVRALADHFKTPFTIDGKQKFVGQGSRDWNEITKQGGQFDPKSWGRLAYREWKNALNDPYLTEAERASKLQSLLADAETGRVKGHEPWILMPREAIKEAKAQVNPAHLEDSLWFKSLNLFGRTANRAILGTNPAWEVAQTVAEAIPIVLAHPELLFNPTKLPSIERDIWRYRKQNPEKALELQAMAGATPISGAALRTPGDMQETYTPVQWADGAKELTRGKTAREALGFAKLRTLGKIDALRQNEYRTVLLAAEADKRFRSFHSSLTGLFDAQRRVSNSFRGRSRADLWDWLQHDPKGKAERVKLEDYVDNVAGNWTAFSRYERDFAPLAIFYGFLRYSMRWSTWTFPKTHPIMATWAYMLAQANANQIDKLTGEGLHEAGLAKTGAAQKPSNPLAYAFPVYSGTAGKKSVLPGGTRISPGQSSLTQALSSGNPAAVLSSANPFLAASIEGLTGVEPFTGEKTTKPQGWAALEQITGLSFPARAKLPFLNNQSLSEKGLEALGAPPRGPASKAYEKLDPGKTIRSGIYPGLPQSARNFGATEALSKSFDLKYGKGKIPGPFDNALVTELLYGNNGKPKPELLPKVLAAIHASEKGSAKVKEAEAPFYPGGGSGNFTSLQKKLLQAVEDAWKTGPSGKPRKIKRGGIGGSGASIGAPGPGSIGGPAGGGIGGPNGVSIGGP